MIAATPRIARAHQLFASRSMSIDVSVAMPASAVPAIPETRHLPRSLQSTLDSAPLLTRVLVPLAVLQPDPDEAAPDPHHEPPRRAPQQRRRAEIALCQEPEQTAEKSNSRPHPEPLPEPQCHADPPICRLSAL